MSISYSEKTYILYLNFIRVCLHVCVRVSVCASVCVERHSEAEEGRLEPRLRSVQLTGNTTALNGSASHLKRDGTICVAQDLFPGDNGFFNFTNTVYGEREGANVRDVPSFPISACMLLRCSTSSDVQRGLLWSGDLNNFSLCSFVLVYSLPVIKASAWGKGKGRESLYQVAVAIWTSHFLCWPVHLA